MAPCHAIAGAQPHDRVALKASNTQCGITEVMQDDFAGAPERRRDVRHHGAGTLEYEVSRTYPRAAAARSRTAGAVFEEDLFVSPLGRRLTVSLRTSTPPRTGPSPTTPPDDYARAGPLLDSADTMTSAHKLSADTTCSLPRRRRRNLTVRETSSGRANCERLLVLATLVGNSETPWPAATSSAMV